MTGGYDPDRLRSRLRSIRLGRVFRVIHRDRRSAPLGAAPTPSRFSDPRKRYAVLYASDAVRCAFWETLSRNRFHAGFLDALDDYDIVLTEPPG